jgi:integrase
VIAVRRNYTAGILSDPKNHEKRDVDVIPEALKALTDWKVECGMPVDDVLVFPGDGPGRYISTSTLTRRVLYPAMERANVPRIGPTGEKRTFHSLRHSFAKRSLELGLQPTWLQANSATHPSWSRPRSTATGSGLNASARLPCLRGRSPSSSPYVRALYAQDYLCLA